MRILMLTHSFNSLAQRLWLELDRRGHEVSVELDINDAVTRQAITLWRPDVVIAPLLKRAIPGDVWRQTRCLVVHPGPPGDRGPSSLDRALMAGREHWGVSVLEAVAELDAGPVWAWRAFALRQATKSSVYRREVVDGAVAAVLEALARIESGAGPLLPDNLQAVALRDNVAGGTLETDSRAGENLQRDPFATEGLHGRPPQADDLRATRLQDGNRQRGGLLPLLRQADRAIDWHRDPTAVVLAKIRAADSQPGVQDRLGGKDVWLHDAWPASGPGNGAPGELIGHSDEALLRATADGAIWIGHLQIPDPASGRKLKLPAVAALRMFDIALPPRLDIASAVASGAPGQVTIETRGDVAIIRFPFASGAMSPARCRALEQAIVAAAAGPARVIVLTGGPEFWSNGIDLATIEASSSPAEASWQAIEAIDDVCLSLLNTQHKWLLAGLAGNAGAGGVFMALAADEVIARQSVVLNPHYRNMGNLYGSEYWTYLLPRRLGQAGAAALMQGRMPVGAPEAAAMGLLDQVLPGSPEAFAAAVIAHAELLATSPRLPAMLAEKQRRRAADDQVQPLAAYRAAELERMRLNFFGFDTSYHVARFDFITKSPESRTPLHLARHRAAAG